MTYQDLFNNVLAFLSAILWIKDIITHTMYLVTWYSKNPHVYFYLLVELNNPAILFKPLQTTRKYDPLHFWFLELG